MCVFLLGTIGSARRVERLGRGARGGGARVERGAVLCHQSVLRQGVLILCALAVVVMSSGERYRKDGVRIQHDTYAPGMAEKYGREGETDNEGFDPYADTVGPGKRFLVVFVWRIV